MRRFFTIIILGALVALAGCASTPFSYLGGIQQPPAIRQAPIDATTHSEANKALSKAHLAKDRINIKISAHELQCGPLNGIATVEGSFNYRGRLYTMRGRGEVHHNALTGFNKAWVCSAAMGRALADGIMRGLSTRD